MKRYRVSKELDLEVSYFLTKAENKMMEAIRHVISQKEFDNLEAHIDNLTLLQRDMYPDSAGVFTVSSDYYKLACGCRDCYRAIHR